MTEPGHPTPEPVPDPDPGPPQPIPPGDPEPVPEPPHAAADFIDAPPAEDAPQWPPAGAFADGRATEIRQTELIDAGWHQPEPSGPWHAQHEAPGEWTTHPPDHLAFEHSPPAEVQPGVQSHPTEMLHPQYEVPLLPMEHEPPRQRKAGLWVTAALVVVLLLCGGGATSAYLLLRNADDGKGAPDPATAVNRFLTAVYTQQDSAQASDVVCRQARDKEKLAARVAQIKNYTADYDGATFRWNDPSISAQTTEHATVAVELTMSTDDEKQAQQALTFTVINKSGWLVCDVAG